jgi:hypothetical protein
VLVRWIYVPIVEQPKVMQTGILLISSILLLQIMVAMTTAVVIAFPAAVVVVPVVVPVVKTEIMAVNSLSLH